MKRLAVVFAIAALLPASSASAWRGEKSIVAARKHTATASARELLREFVPPPGARRVHGWPRDYSHYVAGAPGAEFVDLHKFWIVHSSLASVEAFEKEHVPAGFASSGGGTNRTGTYAELSFDSPAHGAVSRRLSVRISQRKTRTIVQADSQVVWIYPRSPQEVVPAGIHEIDVNAPHVSRHVRDRTQIRTIIRWFDHLPLSPPGIVLMCPAMLVTHVSLVFRSADGSRVATAGVPAPRASICAQTEFLIHGKTQLPLVDKGRGPTFAGRLAHLLGVQFRMPPR